MIRFSTGVLACVIAAAGCGSGENEPPPPTAAPPTDGAMATWALAEAPRVIAGMADRAAAARLGDQLTGVLVGITYFADPALASSSGFQVKALVLPDGRVRYVQFSEGTGTRRNAPWPTPTPEGLRAWDVYLRWAIPQRCAPMALATPEEAAPVSPRQTDVVGWGVVSRERLAELCRGGMGWLNQRAQPSSRVWIWVYTSTGSVSGHCDVTAGGLQCPEPERTVFFNDAM